MRNVNPTLPRCVLPFGPARVDRDRPAGRIRPHCAALPPHDAAVAGSGCAKARLRHDAVLRRLAHAPFGRTQTVLEIVVLRYRCRPCRRVWRHRITAAVPSKGKLSRDAVMLTVSRS